MRTVFGIDVSKETPEVVILVNGERVYDHSFSNENLGFSRLLHDLTQVVNPEIIFKAVGVYSRRLEAILKNNNYAYTRLNPLEDKA